MLEEIVELHRQGRLDEAESRYREALAFNPDDPEMLHLLGIVRRQREDIVEAVRLVRRAIELNPARAQYHATLGGFLLHARQVDAARAEFETCVRIDPNVVGAHSALGQIALMQRDPARAEEHFKRALKLDENRVEVLNGYGNLLVGRGDLDAGLRWLTRAVQVAPRDLAAQTSLGRAYLAKSMHAFAEQALRNALAVRDDYAPARKLLAETLLRQGRDAEARALLEPLLRDPGTRPAALSILGDDARARGDLAAACGHYADAWRLDPSRTRTLAALAATLAQRGMLRQAIEAFGELVAREPRDRGAWRALAALSADAGDLDASERAFRQLLSLDAGDAAALGGLASTLELRGDYEGARSTAGRALEVSPGEALATLVMARAALREGAADAARACLATLDDSRLAPAQARSRAYLSGHLAIAAGDAERAVEHWVRAHEQAGGRTPPRVAAVPDTLVERLRNLMARGPIVGARAPRAFLVGTPGSGVEHLAAWLAAQPGIVLLGDRLGAAARHDGFSEPEARYLDLDDESARVLARRYERPLARFGLAEDAAVVEWLPALDVRLCALGLRLFGTVPWIVVDRDPLHALADWLAQGSAHRYTPLPLEAAHRDLTGREAHVAALRAQHVVPAHFVEGDTLADGSVDLAPLASELGIVPTAFSPPRSPGGLPAMLAREAVASVAKVLRRRVPG